MSKYDILDAIARNVERAKLGQRTEIKGKDGKPASSALGTYQMTDGTRWGVYKKLGLDKEEADRLFMTDPKFERKIAEAHVDELDARIPSTEKEDIRSRKIALGWASGNPHVNENQIMPNTVSKSFPKGQTYGQYADKALGLKRTQDYANAAVAPSDPSPLRSYEPVQAPQVPLTSVTTVKGLDNSAEAQIRRRGYVYDYAATKTPKGSINPLDVQQDKNLASVPSTPKKSLASNILPFASNIANAFTKIPAPPVPTYGSPISLKRVDMSNERNDVERGTRSMDRFAEQQFDPQAGYQAKAFNNAQRFSQLSKVNQDERNLNTGIANDEMKANLLISSQNQNLKNSYDNTLFERKLAQQRFNQENLTNASDKYSAIQDRDAMERSAKYSTDLQMSRDTYGEFKKHQDMWNAEQEDQKKKTIADVTAQRYGGKMRNGGIMSNYTAGSMFKMNFKRIN